MKKVFKEWCDRMPEMFWLCVIAAIALTWVAIAYHDWHSGMLASVWALGGFFIYKDASPKIMKHAVCILIPVGDHYLVVSRKDGGYGMPGGKVEPGESNISAIVRETWEEIGFHIEKELLVSLGAWRDGDQYLVETFLYVTPISENTVANLVSPEGLTISTSEEFSLTDPSVCPFHEYNSLVLEIAKCTSMSLS